MGLLGYLVKRSKEYIELKQLYTQLVQKTTHILEAEDSYRTVRQLLGGAQQNYNTLLERKNELDSLIASMEQDEELIECGVYKPAYTFDFSTEYKLKLDNVRTLQKQKVKDKAAVLIGGAGSKAENNRLAKLLLRAFNGECDALASKVKWNYIPKTLEQVGKTAQALNKLLESHDIVLAPDYINLKLQEMQLINEFQEKKQAEMEEQRAIREEMREEEKARAEYEKALKEAVNEEQRFQKALAEAQAKVANAHGEVLDRLNETVDLLAKQLEGAKEKGLRAQSMAELTKSGHVYVISNEGSFRDSMYKIGMTRRLEPTDRVKELGDASVPFRFDIHAMIYSKDAPSLEKKLHKHFKSRQVNLINDRKEFFFASIDEIEKAVHKFHGKMELTKLAEAREYRESRAMRKAQGQNQN